MNKKILFAGILLVTIITTTSPAKADLFDWLGSKNTEKSTNSKEWSFEKVYSSIQATSFKTYADLSQNNSVLAIADISTATKQKEKSKPKTFVVSASAYSSTVGQTDSTPFITASNTFVRDGIIATNFLPIGTRIKIPAIYGDKQFIVEDRMNSRYWYNIDIWFADRDTAIHFGRKQVVIEIVS